MTRELSVDVLHNPSLDFTALPPRQRRPDSPVRAKPPLDLVVMLRQHSPERLHLSAFRTSQRTPYHGTPNAYLTVSGGELLRAAARLRSLWSSRLVHYQPLDADGMPAGGHPFSDEVDLSAHAELSHRLTQELADEGQYLLERLLEGADRAMTDLRAFLVGTLTGEEGLRVSFDSDLHLPWPMLAVPPPEGAPLLQGFLGYRHQVEQTGAQAFPRTQREVLARALPVTSLNTDVMLDTVGRAPDVRKLLEERSQLTVRTDSEELLGDLAAPVLHDDVMYFWCHGAFVENGSPHPHLAVKLSDSQPIDADLVLLKRRRHTASGDALFRPFVLLNACHTGQTAPEPGMKHLGAALVNLGADGVIGPQFDIPQIFASEYALEFLDRYLSGDSTAGEITLGLVRWYADRFHNPLGLAYSVYCGIDSRLEKAQ
ncbi:CHAT domain-containing protein [Streptomyces sp. NPDC054797]